MTELMAERTDATTGFGIEVYFVQTAVVVNGIPVQRELLIVIMQVILMRPDSRG